MASGQRSDARRRLSPGDLQRLQASVFGRVQGVGFRWYVQRKADQLELVGWVANRSDGSVDVTAEGPVEVLERLLLALREGPAGASVRDVVARYEPARGNISGFSVHSGDHRGD